MKVFTIGFTRKSMEKFFGLLRESGARRMVDVRLDQCLPAPRLRQAGRPRVLPHRDLRDGVCPPAPARTHQGNARRLQEAGDWETYEARFRDLMHERRIEKTILPEIVADGCLPCSEDKPHHCHRRLVAQYLNGHWGGVGIARPG